LHLYSDAVQKWFWDNGRELNADRTAFIFLLPKQTVYILIVNLIVLVSPVKSV